jgi:hypothetical protein
MGQTVAPLNRAQSVFYLRTPLSFCHHGSPAETHWLIEVYQTVFYTSRIQPTGLRGMPEDFVLFTQ